MTTLQKTSSPIASPPGTLSFAPDLRIRSFLLPRERGNLLIYGAPSGPSSEIARVYLGHAHEVLVGGAAPDAPLFVHAADRDAVARHHQVRGAFSRRHRLDDDFEAIPIPGHTPGSTAYLWDGGEHRYLFTADSIYLHDGEWVAAVLGSSDRERYLESLELIRGLDFDVLVPWAATVDRPYLAATDARDTRRRIDAIMRRVRQGADH
jgi:glyoxylase-like metal-dependent hydrolase (beta-lactamase superfamily II)